MGGPFSHAWSHLVTHSFSFVTGYHVSLYGVFKKVTCEWVELYRLGFKITYEFLPSEKAKDSIKSYLSVAKLCLSPSSNGFTIHSITSRSVAAKKTVSHMPIYQPVINFSSQHDADESVPSTNFSF